MDSIDETINDIGTTLNALSLTTGSASNTISSGEKLPTIPEPASVTLLGSALVGLGWLGLRRPKAA